MSGKVTLFSIGQPVVTVAKGRGKPKPDKPKPWPDYVITAVAELPSTEPHFFFKSLSHAKATLRPDLPALDALELSPTTGARQLVVHVEHGPKVDPEELRFFEPLTAKGIDVVLAMVPRRKGGA